MKPLAAGSGIARITRRPDFLAANRGVRVPMPPFVLLVRPNESGVPRVGFTVSRRVGNAVERNRARRRLREAARLVMPEHAVPQADHVFIARRQTPEPEFPELLRLMEKGLRKAQRRLDQAS